MKSIYHTTADAIYYAAILMQMLIEIYQGHKLLVQT